ncbi:MAG: type II secretion system protein GspC [Gammaproteobacteria bacterium]|nr:type II secretion system protein GspC [Gammaproteobacteria bacterium]
MKDWAQELTQHFLIGGLDPRLPVVAAIIAVLLLTHSLAGLTWSLMPLPELQDEKQQLQRPQQDNLQAKQDQPLAQKIRQWHLFGKVEPKKIIKNDKPLIVPETRLNLKLKGVFASTDMAAARAIIADAKGSEDSYRINDEVPGGAILNEIYANRVILEHNGRLETLKLPVDSADSGAIAGRGNRSRNATANRRTNNRNINRTNIASASASTADNSALLGQYRNALLNDPQSVMGLINVRPFQKDGRLIGYRLRPGKDRTVLRRFGLRSGDIVTAVNGVPMNNPIKALEILRDLSSATSLNVDIQRNGTPQSFTFQIQ